MEIKFTPKADEDLYYWKNTNNAQVLRKIRTLLEDIQINAFYGLGKPEPLKHNFSGQWSRRINKDNRLIYEIKNSEIYVYSLRGHY
jgi:toxin YoeB